MDDPQPVNVDEAKTHFSRLLERVAAGEEVVIARAGKPIAKLVPIPAQRPRVPGAWKHIKPPPDSSFFDPLSEEELRLWEGRGSGSSGTHLHHDKPWHGSVGQ